MRPDGMQRLLDTSRTTDGYAHTAGTRYTSVKAMQDAGLAVLELGTMRGALIKLFGAGSADNAVINYRLYIARYSRGSNTAVAGSAGSRIAHIDLEYFGGGTATLANTRTGAAGSSVVGSSEVMADGLTFTIGTDATTPKGPATVQTTAQGVAAPAEYSPADGADDASLLIPDLLDGDALVIDLDLHTNATAANAASINPPTAAKPGTW